MPVVRYLNGRTTPDLDFKIHPHWISLKCIFLSARENTRGFSRNLSGAQIRSLEVILEAPQTPVFDDFLTVLKVCGYLF